MPTVSTRQLLEKIPNFPCLYRHQVSGTYYGIKKLRGKRKEHSLQTSDRKTAERKLKHWLAEIDRIDPSAQRITVAQLIEQFTRENAGKSAKTKATNKSIIKKFQERFGHPLAMLVREVRPSHLNEWLAKCEGDLKNTTYNRYAGFLKQLFEIAVENRIVAESPFAGVKTKWKKPQKPIREIPTQEQFELIVADIRNQKFNADAEATADFVEFLGLAGVGQAEARTLTWGAVDFKARRIAFRRHKTQAVFYVPIYPHLKVFLERLQSKVDAGIAAESKVFQIKDAKKALAAACVRLKLKNFTQRNIRQVLIRRLWKSGVDYKLIAKWQGHQDGGKLILDTYTEVFSDDDASYEQQQLSRIK